MYGPGVYPEIPAEVMAGSPSPGLRMGQVVAEDQARRRSIYVHVKRSLVLPILESFDLAETDRSTPVRFATTQPTQALGMLNGPFMNRQARASSAARLRSARPGPIRRRQVERASGLATGRRQPSEKEIRRGVSLIETSASGSRRDASPELALDLVLPGRAQPQRIPLPRLIDRRPLDASPP